MIDAWLLRILFLPFLLLASISIRAQSLPVVPEPQETEWLQGSFVLSSRTTISAYWPDYADTVAFRQLQEDLDEFGIRFGRSALQEARLLAGLFTHPEAFPKINEAAEFIRDPRIGKEGYHLVITPQNILLLAQTNTGLFYGVQTLRQLLRAFGPSGQLPCLRITDFPAFDFRGVMDDISRGPIPNMSFLKQQIRRLSELKVNYLNFYIEDVVAIPGQEGFASPDALTLAEWQELSEFAGRHHLHLIGGFQSLGHARKVLRHETYAPLGLTERMFRPADPEVHAFLLDVYEQLLPAFNSRYFNINCDEAFDLDRLEDPRAAYGEHIKPLLSYLISRGKQPLIWDDMLQQYPELLDELPRGTIVLPWNYDAETDFSAQLQPLRERQIPFIACPGILNSNRLLPQFDQALANIRGFAAAADSLGALGLLTTTWDDGGHAFFSLDWYAIAYAAEQSWQPGRDSIADFDRRFSRSWMGDRAVLLPRLLRTLNQLDELPPTWRLQDRVLHQRLVPHFGERYPIDTMGWAQIREWAQEGRRLADMLERTAIPGSYAAQDQPYWRLIADLYLALADTRFGLLQMKADYREAAGICASDSAAAEALLRGTFVEALQLSDRWEQLRKSLEQRWLTENRPHALDSIAAPYAERQQRLRRLAGGLLVMGATNDFEDGAKWLSAEHIGLGVVPLERPYFTQWILSNAFLPEEVPSTSPDFLVSRGFNGPLTFDPGAYYRFGDGQRLQWKKYRSPAADWINLGDYQMADTTAAVYAYCRISSPEKISLPALFSYDGSFSLWLDGVPIYQDTEGPNPGGREKECTLPLESGVNHLLLRIEGPPQSRRFSFSLPEHKMRNHKYKYYLLEE